MIDIMIKKQLFNYDDICLVPKYSELSSRSDADTSVNFLGQQFNLPIIPLSIVAFLLP